jgi:hypothetical protein
VQENLDELPGLRIVEEFHPGMLAPALDARPVGDRDRLVSLQAKAPVMPLVADDVPGPKAVDGHVAVVVPQRPVIEVRAAEIGPELMRQPDRPVAGDGVAVALKCVPHAAQAAAEGREIYAALAMFRRTKPGRSTDDKKSEADVPISPSRRGLLDTGSAGSRGEAGGCESRRGEVVDRELGAASRILQPGAVTARDLMKRRAGDLGDGGTGSRRSEEWVLSPPAKHGRYGYPA